MYSRARAYTHGEKTIGERERERRRKKKKKKKHVHTYDENPSPSLRVTKGDETRRRMFARRVQIIAGNEMAKRGGGREYRLRNSASSHFYRVSRGRVQWLASHKCTASSFPPLLVSPFFSLFFFFCFLFRSTRPRGRIQSRDIIPRVAKKR